jgi:regulator of sigma E protease
MLGGIIVNVITGIIIFIVFTYSYGDSYVSINEVNKYGVIPGPIGKELGFEAGDKIVKINGESFEKFSDIRDPHLLLESDSYYTIERNGKEIDIKIPSDFIENFSRNDADYMFVRPKEPFKVGEVIKGKGADTGGLMEGDRIVKIDTQEVRYFHEFKEELSHFADKEVNITVSRPVNEAETSFETKQLSIKVDKDTTMGFYPKSLLNEIKIDYTFMQAIPIGTGRAFSVVWVNIKAFGKMFKGELSPTKNLRGPLGIMKTFGVTWNWLRFWTLTGLISMVLAFMNLLPIPALDGGHVMFLLYEIISGRKPSDKFMEYAQKVGMAILLALMVFIVFNDVIQEFF